MNQIDAGAFSLEGKNVIITGASSGIGKQCAIRCSQYGANLALVGRDVKRLEETQMRLCEGKHILHSADITEYDCIRDIVSKTHYQMGPIGGFIHSAGIAFNKPIHLMDPYDYNKMNSINVVSGYEFIRQLSKKGIYDSNGSSYVLIASVMALAGVSLKTAYCSSKGAIVSDVRAMALELAKKNIRVNSISPGVIATEMVERFEAKTPKDALDNILKSQALGLGSPDSIAYGCIYLLSEASSFITGSNLIIDGGYTAQ